MQDNYTGIDLRSAISSAQVEDRTFNDKETGRQVNYKALVIKMPIPGTDEVYEISESIKGDTKILFSLIAKQASRGTVKVS